MNDKNLLVVTWAAFPPSGGSSIILSNLLKEFNPNKTVIAGEKSYGTKQENFELPKYPVYIFDHKYPTGVRGSNHLKFLSYKKISDQLDQLILKYKIEVIFAVFPDEIYTIAACEAAKRHKLPFYVWFHNTYKDNRFGIRKLISVFAQKRIFNSALKIYTMSEGMNDFYLTKYPKYKSKLAPLLHGFSIPDRLKKVNLEISTPTKFLLSGNLNHSNMDASQRIAQAVLQEDPNNELHIYSNNPVEVWNDLGIKGDKVFIQGFIPLVDLLERFKSHDILLLPHGFGGKLTIAEYKTIFPTRTIPLLYSGKPILAHCPEDTAISIMLKNTKAAYLVNEKSINEIIKGIKKIKGDKDLRSKLVNAAFKASKNYDVVQIAENLKHELFSSHQY